MCSAVLSSCPVKASSARPVKASSARPVMALPDARWLDYLIFLESIFFYVSFLFCKIKVVLSGVLTGARGLGHGCSGARESVLHVRTVGGPRCILAEEGQECARILTQYRARTRPSKKKRKSKKIKRKKEKSKKPEKERKRKKKRKGEKRKREKKEERKKEKKKKGKKEKKKEDIFFW